MSLAALLAEVQDHGARVWRHGDRLRIVPPGKLPARLKQQLVAHKAELLEVLPVAPPEVAALPAIPAPAEPETWVVSSGSRGDMRLVAEGDPGTWPDLVYRAAALVERLDELHRANDHRAQNVADELELLLAELRRQEVCAWLTS